MEAFIARTQVAAPSAAALGQIKALQRVYALTVKDEHMTVLLNHNLNSAYAITRYDEAGFIRAFGPQLGGAAAAGQIHRRARALSSATLNLAIRYGVVQRGPAAGARLNIIDHGSRATPLDASNPSLPSATLEGLFGSLDYCNCSDCNSILSPAAYFVDLLHYLDQPAPTAGLNPQTVLFTRRPDLEYLALSCENTNTTLPYIDIVNETLEAFVAGNLSLEGFEGFNAAADVTSAELIAAPQNVNDNAYAALQASFYPAPLPFNRPLELLRQHMKALGVALPDAMTALRASDAITDSGTPTSYGWSDILIEQLALSRDEYRLFTDTTLQLGDLYGLPRASGQTDQQWNAATLANLQTLSLKDFSTRTSVDYDDLVSILKTQFINPGVALIERVEALGVSFVAIQALHSDPVGNAAAFIAGLPAGLDYSQYGGTDGNAVVNWLTGPNYEVIMGLITIANPTGNADDCTGTSLQFRYANPDTAANLLTATDFLKVIRFIRLWRKLQPLLQISDNGAAIQATDALLSALYPATDLPVGSDSVANDPTNRPLLDAGFKVALLRAGFLVQVLNRLSLASGSLTQLLACWARHWNHRKPIPLRQPVPYSDLVAAGPRLPSRHRLAGGQRGRSADHLDRHRPHPLHRCYLATRRRLSQRQHSGRDQRHNHRRPRVRTSLEPALPCAGHRSAGGHHSRLRDPVERVWVRSRDSECGARHGSHRSVCHCGRRTGRERDIHRHHRHDPGLLCCRSRRHRHHRRRWPRSRHQCHDGASSLFRPAVEHPAGCIGRG